MLKNSLFNPGYVHRANTRISFDDAPPPSSRPKTSISLSLPIERLDSIQTDAQYVINRFHLHFCTLIADWAKATPSQMEIFGINDEWIAMMGIEIAIKFQAENVTLTLTK